MRTLVPRRRVAGLPPSRRRVLSLAGTSLAALLAAGTGANLGYVQVTTGWGIEALADGDLVTAESWFRSAASASWLESWRGPFNVGVALYEQQQWPSAQEQFDAALALVPPERECMVALNLAWSHEAEGDQLAEHAPDQAVRAYQRAEQVAAEANCEYDRESTDQAPTENPEESESEGLEADRGNPDEGEGSAATGDPGDGSADSGTGDDAAGEAAGNGQEGTEQPGDADAGGAEGDGEPEVGGTASGATPVEQQQTTVERVQDKAEQARDAAGGTGGGDGEASGAGEGSVEDRLEDLASQNQAAQQNRQQSGGVGAKLPVEGKTW